MSKFMQFFTLKKTKKPNEKPEEHTNKTEVNYTEHNYEDLPPDFFKRRFSLSKSGRMKEKKRRNIPTYESFPDSQKKTSAPKSKTASRENLDKTE